MLIRDLLKKSSQDLKKTSTTPLLDAEVFLCKAIKKEKEFILANMDFEIPKLQDKKFWEMIERRKKHEPVAYIINKKEFYGLDFYVNENVLIPRPETEIIIDETINIIRAIKQPINIIDVGTGSGCIIGAIANYYCNKNYIVGAENFPPSQKIQLFAIDNNSASLKIAKKNFKKLGLKKIKTLEGNLLEPYLKYYDCRGTTYRVPTTQNIPTAQHIIIANLPYLNEKEYKNCPPDVKKYEPKNALYGGKNGLKYIKNLISQVETHHNASLLKSPSEKIKLILEISPTQSEYFKNNFSKLKIKKDLFKTDRFVILKL